MLRLVVPRYWQAETTGVLRPAVEAYLGGTGMTGEQVAAMRAYLRQWIMAGDWCGPDVDSLCADVNNLTSEAAIRDWLELALRSEIDPL